MIPLVSMLFMVNLGTKVLLSCDGNNNNANGTIHSLIILQSQYSNPCFSLSSSSALDPASDTAFKIQARLCTIMFLYHSYWFIYRYSCSIFHYIFQLVLRMSIKYM